MAARAAVVKGVFLKPGVSANKRLYTKKNIGVAVKSMHKRINSESGLPITMATSHSSAYGDDATSVIGRVTKVTQLPDGSATFEADIADTSAGRDIASLVTPQKPFVKGVSIRGNWEGPVSGTKVNDEDVTTADGLSVHGIDFTGRPGVEGAQITHAEMAESASADPTLIWESVEDSEVEFVDEAAEVTEETPDGISEDVLEQAAEAVFAVQEILEAANKKPYGNVKYADNGYQSDNQKRYPIDTAAHVRAAWSYINMPKNAQAYSSSQLARIKSRIKSAAKKFDINIQSESDELEREMTELLEAYASSCFDNGAAMINVSGYTDDAGKLLALGKRLALAAQAALFTVDPDSDGDVDLDMPGGKTDSSSSAPAGEALQPSDNDNAMGPSYDSAEQCPECTMLLPEEAMFCPNCGAPVPNGESSPPNPTNEEAIVPDDTPTEGAEAESAAPERNLTDADVAAIGSAFAAAITAATPAPVAAESVADEPVIPEATEAAAEPVSAESFTREQVQEMVTKAATDAAKAASDAVRAEAVDAFRGGMPSRKGLAAPAVPVGGTTEGAEIGARELAEMATVHPEEFRQYAAEAWGSQPAFKRLLHDANERYGLSA